LALKGLKRGQVTFSTAPYPDSSETRYSDSLLLYGSREEENAFFKNVGVFS